MATISGPSVSGNVGNISFCKKCTVEHERPVGAKCERSRSVMKDEKKDPVKEVKKTPKTKPANETSSQDKMLDAVLATMSSFTDKLTSMESRLTGLASRLNETSSQKAPSRKSCARDQSKKRETPDEDDTPLFSSPGGTFVRNDAGDSYLKTFPDTAVLVKASATPARPKKQRPDFDLGVAPLPQDNSKPASVSSLPVVRQAAAAFARPEEPVVPPNWDNSQMLVEQIEGENSVQKHMVRDVNHNIYRHVDQFGNPVQVRAMADPLAVVTPQDPNPAVKSTDSSVTAPMTLDSLRMNPYIQQLVEERVAVLETRMKQQL